MDPAAISSHDRVIGRQGHPPGPRRILAVQTQRIGDLLCFTPVLTALRRRFPAARLTALVQATGDELLRYNPDVDGVIAYDARAVRGRPAALLALSRALREQRFDWAFSVHAAGSASWAIRCAGIPWRSCVWRYGASRPPAWFRLYSQGIIQERHRGVKHEVEYNLDALRAVGVEPQHSGMWVTVPAWAEAGADAMLGSRTGARRAPAEDDGACLLAQQHLIDSTRGIAGAHSGHGGSAAVLDAPRFLEAPRGFVVLHPGHAGGRQQWPADHYARLGELLTSAGCRVVVSGSAREAPLCERVTTQMRSPALNLAGRATLLELAAILRSARLFISVPTGPMHLAAAVGTRVVALHGPQELSADPIRFAPYYADATIPRHCPVFSPAGCDCRRMRDCRSPTCLRAITPEIVFDAAKSLLTL
jgi:ADP-heptose:LPS heptosyltransferase